MVGEAQHPSGSEPPLDGLTVVDLSRALAGPFCTMQLGDLGADIIKVERPGTGDQTRGWQPPKYGDQSAYYLSTNRNKRSIALDLSRKRGRAILRRLAEDADILVQNFRVGKMEEWGLGYQNLKEANDGLVYCSISGYGEWGPHKDRRAYDIILQAEGGMMSVTGVEDGEPVRVGVAIADIGAGMYATQAILAALVRRGIDGSGQKIDVSMLDGQAAWMTYLASMYFATDEIPTRMGSKHPTIAPYQAFEAVDGWVIVAVGTEAIWQRLCEAIDREDLVEDERFQTNDRRVSNIDALEEILAPWFGDRQASKAVSRLDEYDVPATQIRDMSEVFSHPQIEARRMRRTIDHPSVGEIEMPGSPMHFSRTPTALNRHPPRLGEHTDEILAEIGYDASDIEAFHSEDIVAR